MWAYQIQEYNTGEITADEEFREIDRSENISHDDPSWLETTSSTAGYQYRSLIQETDLQEIRVLVLEPGSSDQAVEGTLEHHHFLENPAFEAISYVWGDATLNRTTSIDGASLAVTANCLDALKSIRPAKGAAPSRVWIDAVCINQADVNERSQQVGVMGRIFNQASRTIAYLGDPDDHFTAVMKATQSDLAGGMAIDARLAEHLRSLLSRPWFRRTWIIQEVMLSREVMLRCGTKCFAMSTMERTFANSIHYGKILRERGSLFELKMRFNLPWAGWQGLESNGLWQQESFSTSASSEDDHAPNVQENSSPFSGQRSQPNKFLRIPQLFDLIYYTQEFHCSDPRDKVFALLPLFGPKSGMNLQSDYYKSEAEVWNEVGQFLLSMGDSRFLHLPLQTGKKRSSPQLSSSWSCRWRSETFGHEDLSSLEVLDSHPSSPSSSSSSAAVAKLPLRCRFISGRDGLKCWEARGMIIRNVTRITSSMVPTAADSNEPAARRAWAEIYTGMAAAALVRGARKIWHQARDCWLVADLHASNGFHLRDPATTTIEELAQHDTAAIGPAVGAKVFLEDGGEWLSGRPVFSTNRPRLIGVGPHGMRCGDSVCIIPGLNHPFLVIRPTSVSEWSVIGACILGSNSTPEWLSLDPASVALQILEIY